MCIRCGEKIKRGKKRKEEKKKLEGERIYGRIMNELRI